MGQTAGRFTQQQHRARQRPNTIQLCTGDAHPHLHTMHWHAMQPPTWRQPRFFHKRHALLACPPPSHTSCCSGVHRPPGGSWASSTSARPATIQLRTPTTHTACIPSPGGSCASSTSATPCSFSGGSTSAVSSPPYTQPVSMPVAARCSCRRLRGKGQGAGSW